MALPVQAQSGLPTLGDGLELTLGAERRLGDSIIASLYRDPDYLDDPVLQAYVQTLFQQLRDAARARGEIDAELEQHFAWQLLLGRDRSVNAFALPGGYFGVHLGLIAVVGSRDELASVLAHELSHVTQRHIARLLAQQQRQTPLMLAALVLGALAVSKDPHAAQALVVGGQALAVQNQLNFSRDMEREADRMGYALMQPAGLAPQGFVAMFDKLQQANRLNDNGSWPYLRSHPLTTERMADMHARLPTGPGQAPASALAASLESALLSARARVLARPGVDLLRQWREEPQSTGFAQRPRHERASVWYAAALVQAQQGDTAGAQQSLAQLRTLVQGDAPAQHLAHLLAAEVLLQAGGTRAQAQQALDGLGAGRGTRPELVLRSQALLRLGRAKEVSDTLPTWVSVHPQDASVWLLLAQAWEQQGERLRAVRAEAEARVAHCDYAAAIDRFKAGQDLARQSRGPSDDIEAAIIDTRLRAVQALRREQELQR